MPMKKKSKKATKKATKKGTKKATKKAKKKSTKKATKKASPRKKAAGRKAAPRKKAAKKSTAKKTKRAPNPAFMKPMQPSPELGAVVGARPMPRTEVTKRIWDYIKKNGLQDKTNKRMINADDKLRALFGGKSQVSMFDLAKLVSKNVA